MVPEAAPAYLAVARFDKPHGLKGEALLFALTDEPDRLFVEGRALMPLDADGQPTGTAVIVERARRYHRQWLFKFRGVPDRTTLEQWPRALAFGVPSSELTPPRNDQLYRHEIAGVAVVVGNETVGVVKALARAPGGDLLVIDVGGREQLVPFRKPIVKRVDRAARQIELDPPPGLLEL
jgi:16S rRNA processing protein RimM